MMTSLAQSHSPYPGQIQQHPGVPQGHPMAGVPHNPGQQMQGQPGMNPQMHMAGVSGPGGPQVSQAGAMMGGMPPGVGGPSAHALQHLNPGQAQQAQLYQQQMFANGGGQLQQMQQQQMIAQHRQQQAARQAMMAQQYSGAMPGVGMPNGMNQMNPAQFAAMRSNPMARPVNLPQHLQQAQTQIQNTMEQQQAQQQHQQQQQMLQQIAMQQQHAQAQAQAGNNPQGQQGQMNQQQMQNIQHAQMAAQQQAHAHAQAQAAAAAQHNQAQAQSQAQPQPQQPQPQPNPQAQQQQQNPAAQQPSMQQQQASAMQALAQQQQNQRQGEKLKGQCLMRLMQFGDHLSGFAVNSKPLTVYMSNGAQRQAAQAAKQRDDSSYWLRFVDQFFSAKGVLRHGVWVDSDKENKQYEIPFHALARYFNTHFESGIKNMQMIMERGSERELPNNGHYIESSRSSFVYWFDSGAQLIATGQLRAHFDAEQKIELFEFLTSSHEEYLPRTRIIDAARPLHEWSKEWKSLNTLPDGKQSPEMNKKKAKAMKSPQQPPPEIELPLSKIKASMGITPSVFRFLELAEVLGQMNPLFNYSHQNTNLAPYTALEQYVSTQTQTNGNMPNGQPNASGPRTPGMANFPLGASPAAAHLQLPDGSPHMSGSPAQAPNMQLQQSQHGTSSSGPSANTSPNASNKRRRPSTVKVDEENQVNGTAKASIKQSPRVGGKRQKANPA